MADHSIIVEDYEQSIRELTFNSRPIIENLTTIAKENTDHAEGISRAITNRIYKCMPEHKLFALYLLDSVVKNVGNPYNIIMGDEIFKIFSHVYQLVNDQTRGRLVKIYELWKVSKTKNLTAPLFPPEELDRIGSFLQQIGYRKPEETQISAQALIADITTLLPHMQGRLQQTPNDTALAGRCHALSELKMLLQSQPLKINELLGIQAKLAAMKQQELYTAPATPIPTPSVTPVLPTATINKALSLFGDLLASGLVKVDQSLKPGSKPVYEVVIPQQKYEPAGNSAGVLERLLLDSSLSDKSQYEQIRYKELVKVAQKIRGNTNVGQSLQNFVTSVNLDALTVQLLYECKPLKCAQCGKRFTAEEADHKRVHLDWHFRINKKQANFKLNIQSRNWYLDEFDWVKFRDDNLLEYAAAPTASIANDAPSSTQALYVVIPSNETNMNNTCVICREQIKPSYKDQLGEWVWDECMYAPGNKSGRKIVHVSCFHEASRKRGGEELEQNVKRERI